MYEHILSAVIFVPLLGALIALFAPEKAAKWICTIFAVLAFLVSIPLATGFQRPELPSFKTYVERSVLPQAFVAHGMPKESQQKAALERMRAEKEQRYAQAKLESTQDPSHRAELVAVMKQDRVNRTVEQFRATFDEVERESAETNYRGLLRDTSDLDDAAQSRFATGMRFTEHMNWIPTFRIHYLVAADGLSLPLILLTTLLTVLCLVYSWQFDYDKPPAERRPLKAFYILFLILETGLIGVFCSLDFFLFFVFWEIVLLPSYFLIGIWGGENRNYASIKFFIYTLVGSITMLVAMLALYFRFVPHTFNVLALQEMARQYAGTGLYSTRFQVAMFALLFLGFAIKVPVFPFHTWLPDAHVQAPTAFSVMLAGVMLKMGGYGFFRFSLPLCPDAMLQQSMVWLLGGLGLINIVYGALVAMGQSDFKSLVAYSSVSHMGYVLLGLATLTATGLDGAALQMVNHGFSSAGMFFVVGIIYDRAHHRDLNKFGGIALQMPRYFGFALVILFASLGLPGLNGFISEAFTFIGCWQSTVLPRWITLVSMTGGILFGAAYILWTIRRVFLGPLTVEKYKHFPDLEAREVFALAPLALGCVVLGVYPRLVTETLGLEAAVDTLLGILNLPATAGFRTEVLAMFQTLAVNWQQAIETAITGGRALGPECVLVAVACAALLLDLVTPREKSGERLAWLAVFGTFFAGFVAAFQFNNPGQLIFWGSVSVDRFASFFKGIILLGTIFSVVLVHESRELLGRAMGEFYGLLFMAVSGMCLMVGANDMVTAFLSIELVSIPSFALVAYVRRDRLGTEAAIKYVLYSAFSSGALLFGLSILFGISGSTNFSRMTHIIAGHDTVTSITAAVACLLAFGGFAFKMAAAPFHFWAPDVYQGAPTPVTAWLSVTSKAAGIGLFVRFVLAFHKVEAVPHPELGSVHDSSFVFGGFDWVTALIIISCLTMTIGNLGAIFQTSMKRLLAYSSVAHVGYMLMGIAAIQVGPGRTGEGYSFSLPYAGVVAPDPNGGAAVAFYMAAYLFMNLGAFACVIAVSNVTGDDNLSSFRALGRRAPVLALAFAMFLFAFIGLPPTAGFTGKLQLFMAAVDQAHHRPGFWWLVAVAGANSVVAVYYYLKIAKTMFFEGIMEPDAREPLPVSWALTLVASLLVVPVLALGLSFSRILDVTLALEILR